MLLFMAIAANHRILAACLWCLLIVLLVALLAACNSTPEEVVDDVAPAELDRTQVLNEADPAETVITGEERSLIIWAPPFLMHPDEDSDSSSFGAVTNDFKEANPGVELTILAKAETGPSSLHDYVQSASQVAPAILPDIVLIETQHLWPLVEQLNIPALTADELGIHLESAYPFAQNAVAIQEQIYGIPYAASIIHMVYASEEFQNQSIEIDIPKSWPDLLSAETSYLFAAAGKDRASSDMLLLQYVGAGGQLSTDGSVGNAEALTALFNFMASGTESGLFPLQNREMSEDSAAWEEFIVSRLGMVNVRSEQYLGQHGVLTNTGYAAIPTRSGLAVTIGRVWAFAVITDEPSKRVLALKLIDRLLAPQVHGDWSQNSRRVPTHIDAFSTWGNEDPYYDFLRQQMDIALAVPNGEAFAKLSQQIQAAQLSVLDGEMTAPEAVDSVLSLD